MEKSVQGMETEGKEVKKSPPFFGCADAVRSSFFPNSVLGFSSSSEGFSWMRWSHYTAWTVTSVFRLVNLCIQLSNLPEISNLNFQELLIEHAQLNLTLVSQTWNIQDRPSPTRNTLLPSEFLFFISGIIIVLSNQPWQYSYLWLFLYPSRSLYWIVHWLRSVLKESHDPRFLTSRFQAGVHQITSTWDLED